MKPGKLHTAGKVVRAMVGASLFLTLFHGCFTGVESTPKIGLSEVKHQNAANANAETYLTDVRPEPFAQWKAGKEFYVVDPKISMIFQPVKEMPSIAAGDTLLFAGAEEVVSPVGKATDIVFHTRTDATPLTYRLNLNREELASQSGGLTIPFTIELDIVGEVREAMLGKDFYLTTPRWIDGQGHPTTQYKFIPAKIVDVAPGTQEFPVRITFLPRYAKLTDGSPYSVLMSVGEGRTATRNFDALFSLRDPREKHQNISAENWSLIIENRVSRGMTRDEARLALGSPVDVDRGHDYSTVYERWIYDGGVYLIFHDGILETFRR